MLVLFKEDIIYLSLNATCSHHDITETFVILALNNNQSLTNLIAKFAHLTQ